MSSLLTTIQAAEYLGLSPQTLADWRHKGAGPKFVRVGTRTVRYRLSDLDAFVSSSLVGGDSR